MAQLYASNGGCETLSHFYCISLDSGRDDPQLRDLDQSTFPVAHEHRGITSALSFTTIIPLIASHQMAGTHKVASCLRLIRREIM